MRRRAPPGVENLDLLPRKASCCERKETPLKKIILEEPTEFNKKTEQKNLESSAALRSATIYPRGKIG